MTPSYIVVHTAAFRGDPGIDVITRWHTDPFLLPDGRLRYLREFYDSDAHLPAAVRGRRGNGWSAVGYHWVIRKDGTTEAGRAEDQVGAHCSDGGMNHKSIGVCFSGHGNFEPWTSEQWQAFNALFVRWQTDYNIPVKRVIGHREAGANKDCPGTLIDMDEVRRKLAVRHEGTL